ncbi:MAG: hypothetical protein QGG36_03385 [Pirellulaceae bacterium]|nr:hypothetical protein [Pirellulaceae bacterium]MDP7014821.1 hypothetical protein [Pirellulaceae bacterium]
MWRALFVAVGISLCIVGGECLVIDNAVLAAAPAKSGVSKEATAPREIRPPEWAPWSLISAGAVVLLYSFTIPRRVAT